jgi:large subunit ribosomal protein L10
VPKQEKIDTVNAFADEIKDQDLIFFDYKGVNVADFTEIRNKMRENGSTIKVLKNSLIKRALEKNEITPPEDIFKGMSAVAISRDEFSSTGKVLYDAQRAEKVSIKGGYYDGSVVDGEYVQKLATIPPRDVLYSMLVSCLQGPTANLVYVLQAIADKKVEGGDAEPVEAKKEADGDTSAPEAEKTEATEETAEAKPEEADAEETKEETGSEEKAEGEAASDNSDQ